MASAPLRVLFCCTGVGILNRGIELFFREAFDNLHAVAGLQARLLKGGGPSSELEQVVRCIPRTSCARRGDRQSCPPQRLCRRAMVVVPAGRAPDPGVPARGRLLQRRQSRLPPLLAAALGRRSLPAPVLERRSVPAALRQAGLRPSGQSGLSRGGAARGRAAGKAHHGPLRPPGRRAPVQCRRWFPARVARTPRVARRSAGGAERRLDQPRPQAHGLRGRGGRKAARAAARS